MTTTNKTTTAAKASKKGFAQRTSDALSAALTPRTEEETKLVAEAARLAAKALAPSKPAAKRAPTPVAVPIEQMLDSVAAKASKPSGLSARQIAAAVMKLTSEQRIALHTTVTDAAPSKTMTVRAVAGAIGKALDGKPLPAGFVVKTSAAPKAARKTKASADGAVSHGSKAKGRRGFVIALVTKAGVTFEALGAALAKQFGDDPEHARRFARADLASTNTGMRLAWAEYTGCFAIDDEKGTIRLARQPKSLG